MTELPQRHIKLKEWGRLVDAIRDPGEAYIATTDGSIEPGVFRLRTDRNGFIVGSKTVDAESPIVILGQRCRMHVHFRRRPAIVRGRERIFIFWPRYHRS